MPKICGLVPKSSERTIKAEQSPCRHHRGDPHLHRRVTHALFRFGRHQTADNRQNAPTDTVTASVSTDVFSPHSIDEAKIIGDAERRSVISVKTERTELKRRGILKPDFSENEEEMRLAEEQQCRGR